MASDKAREKGLPAISDIKDEFEQLAGQLGVRD